MVAGESTIGIGMIGCGTVGGGIAQLLREQSPLYAQRVGKSLQLRRVLVRDRLKPRGDCIDPQIITDDADRFFNTDDMTIVIEVAGGTGDIGDYVRRALSSGKHVVTANKALLAAEGPALYTLAHEHDTAIAFEASCGGGIPVVTALQFGLMANAHQALYGILNGTCNYILTEMTRRSKSFAVALAEAQQKGFAEADPDLDVSGKDAAQKLAVLASLAFGVNVCAEHVRCEGISALEVADIQFGGELGYDVKLLAIAQRAPDDAQALSLRVQPCFIHKDTMMAQVAGPFNALSVYGHATGHTMYYGRGAGQMPTAAAVVSDVINIASGWYPHAFARLNLWNARYASPRLLDPDDLQSRFYLRIRARDVPGVMARVSQILGEAGISLGALRQHEEAVGQFVPVVIITHQARQGAFMAAVAEIEKSEVIDAKPVCIPIVDLPEG